LDPEHLVEFGIQSHCNSPALWSYVQKKGVRVVQLSELRMGNPVERFRLELERLAQQVDAIVISLDLDALSEAYCPGVSAPQAEGLSAQQVIAMMEIAGASSKVRSLGVFELNPEHDRGDMTARVAATAVHHFIDAALLSS
jgi:arginase family enzyme